MCMDMVSGGIEGSIRDSRGEEAWSTDWTGGESGRVGKKLVYVLYVCLCVGILAGYTYLVDARM